MKKFLLATLAALTLAARADAPWANAEHVFYLRIESDPPDAIVTTIPDRDGIDATVLGHTPFVLPIEMNWGRSYLRKNWEKLFLATRGNIATNEYDKDNKEHTVLVTFAIEKPGHARQVVQQTAGVFRYDDRAENWDHVLDALPEKRTLLIKLVPDSATAQEPEPQPAAGSTNAAAGKTATVIVASGKIESMESLGYALVQEPVGIAVFVDGVRAGTAPLRVMLPAGSHNFNTLHQGKPTPPQTIAIEARKTVSVTLHLPAN